ncbi:NUDIX domain-containing protein [Candidatus Daviesbacteria bacterium]|nr:NUDIX domain-containing protein [Candidatus Daviesbacteria bacterium]
MKKQFTSTAYIVAKIGSQIKVLLHKHKKQGIWIGIGGHIEEGENPYQTVLREVKEETNLDIKIISYEKLIKIKGVKQFPSPVAILEETIPDHSSEPSHIHIDCIYLAFCKKPKDIKMNEEFAWFAKKDLKDSRIRKEVFYFANKLLSSL